MLPIKLEMCGIHSFKKEQVVDFSKINGGFFGIFGATGSGKSTILDAITLALYGKVSRAKVSNDFINLSSDKAWVRFCFELFSNGQTETFLIERNFKRKKDNKPAESTAVLYKRVGDSFVVCAEGVFDCDAYIKKTFGLGYDEFSKCIALPQGQFAEFLKCTPNERTGLISNVFDLQGYGAPLYDKAKEKEQGLKVSLAEIKGKLAELTEISEENLAEFESKATVAKQEAGALEQELNELTKRYDEGKQVNFKRQQLEKAQSRAETLAQEEEQMQELKEKIAKIKLAMPLAGSLEELTSLSVEAKKLQMQFEESKQNFAEINDKYNAVREEFQIIDATYATNYSNLLKRIGELSGLVEKNGQLQELEQSRLSLTKERENLEKNKKELEERKEVLANNTAILKKDAQNITEILKELEVDSTLVSQVKKGVELQSQIEVLDKVANHANESLKQQRERKQGLEKSRDELERQIKENKKVISGELEGINYNLEEKTKIWKQLEEDKTSLIEMQDIKYMLGVVDEFIAGFVKSKSNLQEVEQITKSEIEALEKKFKVAEREKETKKNEFLKLQKQREEGLIGVGGFYVYDKAKVGSNCPVCGEKIEHKINSFVNAREVQSEKVQDAFVEFNLENERLLKLGIELEGKRKVLLDTQENIEKINGEIKFLQQKQEILRQKYVSPYENATIEDKIALKEDNCAKLLQKIKNIDEKMQNNLHFEINLANLNGQIMVLETEIGDFEEHLSAIYALKNERKQIVNNLERRLEGQSLWSVKNAIEANLEKIEIHNKKLKEIDEKLQALGQELQSVDVKIATVDLEIGAKQSKSEDIALKIYEINNLLKVQIGDGESLDEVLAQSQKELKDLEEKHGNLKTQLDALYLKNVNAETELKVITSRVREKLELFETKNMQFDKVLKENGFVDCEQLKSYANMAGSLKVQEEQLEKFISEKGIVKAEIEHLARELEGVTPLFEETQPLEQQIAEIKDKLSDLKIEIGKNEGEAQRIAGKLQQKKALEENLDTLEKDLDIAKELVKVLRGKALAQFICDEYIEEITARANVVSALLLDGKFTLKYQDGEFLVEDNLNSGEPRAVSTLSGGETFLISLSLSLAISETIATMSGKSMDFFFLDEGFGTLDSELCETVVNALFKLESKNLKIGVISHVELLKERIKNKIIVTKSEDEGSNIRIECGL